MINTGARAGLIVALHRATHASLHALAARLTGLELGSAEMNVLAVLADGASRSVGSIADETSTKPGTLTSVLDRLAGKGLIRRELDPRDRRSFVVSLTEDGRAAAGAVSAAIADLERTAARTVSPAQLAGFQAVTTALLEASR